MARNRPILLLPEKREFGTRDAAEFLNVSRPFVIKEAESGRLKYRLVGTHRRFLYTDLLAYIKDMNTKQVALEQMAQNARKLGLKY
jgi:excisionase family DNA binding protein